MRNVSDLKKEFEEQFGTTLTVRQLWALVKLSKHVRLRCRNNAAFNNFMSAMFPQASFRQVTKTRTSGPYVGQTYPGLEIAIREASGVLTVSSPEEDDD